MTDRRPRQVPNDGFELLTEDIENIIQDEMDDVGDALRDTDYDLVGDGGGIISGYEISGVGGANLTIPAGVAYTTRQTRIETALESVSTAALAAGSYYVDKVVAFADDSAATHPFSGAAGYKRKILSITTVFRDVADPGTPTDLVGDDYVRIGKIVITGGVGVMSAIGDAANLYITTVIPNSTFRLYGDAGGTMSPIYGVQGNKRFWRFKKVVGTAVTAVESAHTWLPDVWYLDVEIPTDIAGTPTATHSDVATAINASAIHFYAVCGGFPLIGAGLFPPAGYYEEYYQQITGGSDYRQFKVCKVGSESMMSQDPIYAQRFQPDTDTMSWHATRKGHGDITENNPHGMAAEDIQGYTDSWTDHQRREHNRNRCGIARGSSPAWLTVTGDSLASLTATTSVDPTVDRAIVNGTVVTAAINSTFSEVPGVAFNIYTSEINMSSSGALYITKIADWTDNPGANIVKNDFPITNEVLLPVVAKSPNLTGTIHLEVIAAAGPTYLARVYFGGVAGPQVNVSAILTTYRLYTVMGEWIDVYHENDAGSPLPAGTYENDIVCVASDQNATALTVCTAVWSSGTGLSSKWRHITDYRKYGTFSMEHDTYGLVGDALEYGSRFSGPSLLDGQAVPNSLVHFEVDYRGQTYRMPRTLLATIAAGSTAFVNGSNYVAVRFYEHRIPAIINLGNTLTGTLNRETDVLLGNVIYALGAPVYANSTFFRQVPGQKYVGLHLTVGDSGWAIDDALNYISVCCSDPAIAASTTFEIDLKSSQVSTVLAATAGRIYINGNGYYISGDTLVEAQVVVLKNVVLSSDFRFSQTHYATSVFLTDNCFVSGAYTAPFCNMNSTASLAIARDSSFSFSGNVAAFYANSTVSDIRISGISWNATGANTALVQSPDGVTTTSVDVLDSKIAGVGTVLRLDGKTTKLVLKNNDWVNSSTVPPIMFSSASSPVVNLQMEGNRLTWTRTDNTANTKMIDLFVTGDLSLTASITNNQWYLSHHANTTDPWLFHTKLVAGGTFGGAYIKFDGNTYFVTAAGTASAADSFIVFMNEIPVSYDGTYSVLNEKIILDTGTLAVAHTAGVVTVCSFVIDGLAFVTEAAPANKHCFVEGQSDDSCCARNISFPINGSDADEALVQLVGKSVVADNISNVTILSVQASDDYFSIKAHGVSGRRGNVNEILIDIDANSKIGSIMTSGCLVQHATEWGADDGTMLLSRVKNPVAGTSSFAVGNCQKGGNAAVVTGYTVTSNHHIP